MVLSADMGRRLRVLQIFNRYLEFGGEQASVFRIGDALQERADVEYFTYSSEALIGARNPADMAAAAFLAFHNGDAVRRLERYQRIGKFDIWQIHNVFPALSPSVYKLAFKLGVPVVQYLHNYRMSCVNGFFLNHGETCTSCIHGNFTKAALTGCWRESRLVSGWMGLVMGRVRAMDVFHRVAAWIALSKAQKDLHVRMGIPVDAIHVLPHFFEPHPGLFVAAHGRDVLFVGRLSKEKGVSHLLDAWKQTAGGGAKLVIAGEGPEKAALEGKVAAERIGNVEFAGFVPKDQQDVLWQRAAFSVVPSIWQDPLPTVVFEAWERGRTVIVSEVGGLADSVEHGTDGLKVPMRDARAWARAMGDLLARPAECAKMARAGLMKLQTSYTRSAWLGRLESVYRLATGGPIAAE